MEEWIKVSAKTVDDAVLEASIQLGCSRDNIEYRVIERESRGFLGIGARPAVIEAQKKVVLDEKAMIDEIFNQESAPVKKPKKEPKKEHKEVHREEPQKETPAPVKHEVKKEEPIQQKAPVKEPVKAAVAEEKAEEKPARLPADPAEVKSRAENFLNEVFAAMHVNASLKTSFEDGTLNIEISGDDMGILIGKRGQTLDSLQYLTSLVVNKGKAAYVRVKMDTEDYRERRKATLENLAKNIAFKVKKTRRPVYLEPMNPYERRIIHSALQNDPYVTTHSEGEEPCRKVVVTLKKRENAPRDKE